MTNLNTRQRIRWQIYNQAVSLRWNKSRACEMSFNTVKEQFVYGVINQVRRYIARPVVNQIRQVQNQSQNQI